MGKNVLNKIQSSPTEFVFITIFAIGILLLTLVIDAPIHDGYVRPIIAECYESNVSEFCEERREELLQKNPILDWFRINFLSEQDQQLQLGGQYWLVLLVVVMFLGAVAGLGRMAGGYLAGAEINPMFFIIGLLWFFSAISFYYFGWLDYLYYVSRGLEVDATLPWLNGIGLFQFVQPFGATQHVDDTDLYLLMTIGVVVYVGLWSLMLHHHKKKTFKKLGLV